MKKPETQKLSVDGPQGQLEALLSIPSHPSGYIAVVCHPHPLYGGTMDNKVVHYTARALLDVGVVVLRFNFRGVGRSSGTFDEAVGEIEDCRAAVDWMTQQFEGQQLILAGFSFGSYIAARVAKQVSPAALITVAPAVNLYDFNAIDSLQCPWLLIQGDADEVVPPESVRQWLEQFDKVSDVVWMPEAGHFFHGRLLELAANISRWLDNNL
jgi:alpha/beta superfamily hydrolase